MKAEINKDGKLNLIAETDKEDDTLIEWIRSNKGRIYIPRKRDEYAYTKFDSIEIAIIKEINE